MPHTPVESHSTRRGRKRARPEFPAVAFGSVLLVTPGQRSATDCPRTPRRMARASGSSWRLVSPERERREAPARVLESQNTL